MRMRCLLTLLGLISTHAYAAPVYKVTDAQGNITYSTEAPAPAAGQQVDFITPPVQPRDNAVQTTTARERQLQDAATTVDHRANQRRAQRTANEAKLREAQAALAAARQAYTEGQTPQPGERIGTVYGTSRLSASYFERIQQLDAAVKAAEQAVAAAQKQLRDSP